LIGAPDLFILPDGGPMAMSNSPAAATRPARSRGFTSRKLAPYLFLAPFVLLFIAFIVAPLVYAFYMSLYRDTLVGGRQFAGAASYVKVMGDAKFWEGVWNLVLFGIVQMPIMLGLALLFAIVLDRGQVYAKGVFRLGFFLPYAVPSVIATIIWGYLYGPTFGPFTQMAKAFNLPPPDFLSPGAMIFSLANIVTWEYVGYNMVIYYAALKAIPSEVIEAATVDGAGQLRIAWSIKIPHVIPAIVLTGVFSIIGTLQLFNEPQVLRTITSNVSSDFTPNMAILDITSNQNNLNLGAAMAVLLGIVTFLLSLVVSRFDSNRVRSR
jgi:multiple sugar transport system permease protein